MRVFSVYFWYSEGWTPRNEALLEAVFKRARVTRHSWLEVCVANVSPVEFEKSIWFQRNRMHVVAPEKASMCRSKGVKGERIEKVYDCVIACDSLKGKISQMAVVEDFESRPHKAVSFFGRERHGGSGMERAKAAKGVAWLQWRQAARKKHKRKWQRRRGGRGETVE